MNTAGMGLPHSRAKLAHQFRHHHAIARDPCPQPVHVRLECVEDRCNYGCRIAVYKPFLRLGFSKCDLECQHRGDICLDRKA